MASLPVPHAAYGGSASSRAGPGGTPSKAQSEVHRHTPGQPFLAKARGPGQGGATQNSWNATRGRLLGNVPQPGLATPQGGVTPQGGGTPQAALVQGAGQRNPSLGQSTSSVPGVNSWRNFANSQSPGASGRHGSTTIHPAQQPPPQSGTPHSRASSKGACSDSRVGIGIGSASIGSAGSVGPGPRPCQSPVGSTSSTPAVARQLGHSRSSSTDSQQVPVPSDGSSRRAPSVDSQASSSLNARSPGGDLRLLKSRREALNAPLDVQLQAMRGAYENSAALLRQGPELTALRDPQKPNTVDLARALLDAAAALHGETAQHLQVGEALQVVGSGTLATERGSALAELQQQLNRQIEMQNEGLAALTARWERRISALEQALNTGLEAANSTAGAMNERMAKFVRFSEVLEAAVEKSISASKDLASMSNRVLTIEDDVACLARELANDKGERSKSYNMLLRQADTQVSAMCESMRDQLRQEFNLGGAHAAACVSQAPGFSGSPSMDVERIAWELTQESNERRRVTVEVQSVKSEMELIRNSLDSTNQHVVNLSRELRHVVKGGSSRTPSTSESAQRLDTLGKELRGELLNSGRSRKGLRSPGTSGRMNRVGPNIERIEEEPPHTDGASVEVPQGSEVSSSTVAPPESTPAPAAPQSEAAQRVSTPATQKAVFHPYAGAPQGGTVPIATRAMQTRPQNVESTPCARSGTTHAMGYGGQAPIPRGWGPEFPKTAPLHPSTVTAVPKSEGTDGSEDSADAGSSSFGQILGRIMGRSSV